MTPQISVIVPVYNTVSYLHRCLDSLINQTLSNIEILCVNDASLDLSLDTLLAYQQKDPRVKVFNLETNRGEAGARNFALPYAQGEYIGFVDSDDYVERDFYEKLYAKASSNSTDICKGLVKRLEGDNFTILNKINAQLHKGKYYFFCEFSTAIYRNELIKKHAITFMDGITCGADIAFLIQAVAHAQSIATEDTAAYVYCRREGSADSETLSLDKINDILTSTHFIVDFLNTFDITIEDYILVLNRRFSILRFLATRATPAERVTASIMLAQSLHQLYAKFKHKEAFIRSEQRYCYTLLDSGDINTLAAHLQKTQATQLAAELRTQVRTTLLKAKQL